ncbi:hypothetical protein EU528_05455 [Candidatus Thorarchaeota archaeon]|nr:MAG: hypothetical protein EU528_05455 [Candidatus Thorarchaeota archaeon]
MKQFYYVAVFILCVLQIAVLSQTPLSLGYADNQEYLAAGLNPIQLLPDSYFESTPEFTVNGSSGELSAQMVDSGNIVNLTWVHHANTSLEWNPVYWNQPECKDFTMLHQSFAWNADYVPGDAVAGIEYEWRTTGNFSTNEDAHLMCSLYVWVIDSSGNWVKLISSGPSDSGVEHFEKHDLNREERDNVWYGIYIGEDPSNQLTFAAGISPTHSFQSYGGTEPWREYNGTVTLLIHSIRFEYANQNSNDPEEPTLLPIRNTSYWTDDRECLYDLEIGPDGHIYGVGLSRSFDAVDWGTVLVKWDPSSRVVWGKQNFDSSRGWARSLTVSNDSIYTAGFALNDILLMKWSLNGQILWNLTLDLGLNDYAHKIVQSPDGSLYVLCGGEGLLDDVWTQRGTLLKLTETGDILWNRTLSGIMVPYMEYDLELLPDGTALSMGPYHHITRWTAEGEEIPLPDPFNQTYFQKMTTGPNGKIYTFVNGIDNSIVFSCWNSDGELLYQNEFSMHYNELWSEYLEVDSMTTSRNGSVYAVVTSNRFYDLYKRILLGFDSEGNLELNRTILDASWTTEPIHIVISSEDRIYIGGTQLTGTIYYSVEGRSQRAGNRDLALALFDPFDTYVEFPLSVIVIGSLVVFGVIVLLIAFWKKQ